MTLRYQFWGHVSAADFTERIGLYAELEHVFGPQGYVYSTAQLLDSALLRIFAGVSPLRLELLPAGQGSCPGLGG
ncbi:MAG TPA: hypothetical protein EYP53_06625 [Candidatus Latescibacteria bacterium]|nr:hypothetical protein [Candidatus Latescibacterota bacterium]